MTTLYPNLSRWILPLCLIPCCLDGAAQTRPMPADHTFITHSPVLLPKLLEEKQYDAMRNFLANWQQTQYPSLELIFAAEALIAMETGTFSSYLLPCDCLLFLSDYARELKNVGGGNFRYYLQLDPPFTYDATIEARSMIIFLRTWAQDLLRRREDSLNKDERFICHTLAGDIADPQAAANTDPGSCPRMTYARRMMKSYDNSIIDHNRNRHAVVAALLVGSWIPTGDLRQVLGVHPAVGLQLGGRNRLNEYDVTYTFRFLHPTPQAYTIMRGDTAYSRRYYDGGYVGFEYTRYIIHRRYLDIGLTAGMGYDYFNVASGWGDDPAFTRLEPFNIGSVNLNYGLRIKKFFMNSSNIGICVKYNLIAYQNAGGTNLNGNAFTIDLSYGLN